MLIYFAIYTLFLSKKDLSEAEDELDPEKADFEGLVDFFEAIPDYQKKQLIDNESYYREKYGLKTMSDECW